MADKPFRLTKVISPVQMTRTLGNWTVNAFPDVGDASDWELLSASVNPAFTIAWSQTIDLEGWVRGEKTAFFGNLFRQIPTLPLTTVAFDPSGGSTMTDTLVVTDSPVSDVGDEVSGLGTFTSNTDFFATKMCNVRDYVQTQNAPNYFAPLDTRELGSNDPTATDKLYLYRIVNFVPSALLQDNDTVLFYPQRFVGTGLTTEESDLVHLGRLYKSFEHISVG